MDGGFSGSAALARRSQYRTHCRDAHIAVGPAGAALQFISDVEHRPPALLKLPKQQTPLEIPSSRYSTHPASPRPDGGGARAAPGSAAGRVRARAAGHPAPTAGGQQPTIVDQLPAAGGHHVPWSHTNQRHDQRVGDTPIRVPPALSPGLLVPWITLPTPPTCSARRRLLKYDVQ